MRRWTGSALVRVMACCLFGAKPLPDPMLIYCQLDPWQQASNWNATFFIQENIFENCVFEMEDILSEERWVKINILGFVRVTPCSHRMEFSDFQHSRQPIRGHIRKWMIYSLICCCQLISWTHRSRNKISDLLQMIFSNACSWWKSVSFDSNRAQLYS